MALLYTSPSGFTYDVFLSFRGEDTRRNFTDHLYTALVNAGFHTFRDDPELERGENIQEKLDTAIQQSRSSVIVFSKDYTSSRWCLDELVMILERKRTSDHVILPVFYDVDPSQVRKQAKSLAKVLKHQQNQSPEKLNRWREAIQEVADLARMVLAKSLAKVLKHQQNQSPEKLNRWRGALGEVADLAGMVLANEADGHEAKFIQKIVEEIQKKLGRVPLNNVQVELEEKLRSANRDIDNTEGKQLNNPSVRDWLSVLKEAVYVADDLLQEIKTEALRQKMEPESGSSTSEVQELNSGPPSHAFQSALVYRRVKEVLDRLDSIMERRRDVLSMEATAGCRVSQTIQSTSLVGHSGVCGRDAEKETLIKLLLSDDESRNKTSVIAIVGLGGIGKTTLAQLLYNDVRVEQHFYIQAWVCVSEYFDVLRISQQIYESLTSEACQISNLGVVQSKLQSKLNGKRFILVLDDLWKKNYNQLESLRRPFESGAQGSKIIVTTRDENVARVMGSVVAHRLRPMSEEDGWSLFKKHAFNNEVVSAGSPFEKIGRQVVQKCNGLPLAIKSLAGLLCSKLSVEGWESILNSDMWELSADESDILPSLWLSYTNLPPHLKRCFAHCSIFRKNYKIQASELVMLWNAEDLLQPKENKMAEEIGQEYIKDLTSMSFFQISSSDDDLQLLTMHDLINDLATFVSGEFCFWWEGSDLPNILRQTRHISCGSRYHSDGMIQALQQAKGLHTLLLQPPYQWSISSLCKGLIESLPELQCLRALKLANCNIRELPDSVNNLKQLRHLDLSGNPIKKLPDAICTLYNLQALLLSDCRFLAELPPNLARLINLSHLDIEGTRRLKRMPRDMSKLKDLQMLPKFVLDKHTAKDDLPELQELQHLHGRLCISGLMHSRGLEAYILRDKKFLNELVLEWGKSEDCNMAVEREVLEKLQPHLNLKRLTIESYGGRMFPGWSGYYYSSAESSLVYLKLADCVNCISLPSLGELPSLRELDISGLNKVESLGPEFYYGDGIGNKIRPFRSLRSLKFDNMSRWKEWCYVGGDDNEGAVVFPNLVKLVITSCHNLTGELALDSFPMLKEIKLNGTNLCPVSRSGTHLSLNELELSICPNIASFPGGLIYAPNLTYLKIEECSNSSSWTEPLHSPLPSPVSLQVWNCPELEWLKLLEIMECKKLNANSMRYLSRQGFSGLTSLENVDSWSAEVEEGMFPSSLTHLEIWHLNCETINGTKWFGHLNSLKQLMIHDCPALRCLPDSGLPSSLSELDIEFCPLLRCLPDSGLPSSLQRLKIWGCSSLECLPDSGLPSSLSELRIEYCPLLRCLPDSGLPSSLQSLNIWGCSSLECLPDSGLPSSLSVLHIFGCPLLKKRCERETGEDWPKIAHISDIFIH